MKTKKHENQALEGGSCSAKGKSIPNVFVHGFLVNCCDTDGEGEGGGVEEGDCNYDGSWIAYSADVLEPRVGGAGIFVGSGHVDGKGFG